jgi:hypothetical protein
MRLPRFLLAGALLLAAVFLLTGLLAQPPYRWVGASAAAVFVPLWYAIAAINAWLGVASAGYRLAEEAPVFGLVFGIPAVLAGLAWWASAAWWEGGPLIHSRRALVLWAAGLALWGAVWLLALLLAPSAATRGAAVVFVPLWTLICIVDLMIGVAAAGYSAAEELLVLVPNLAIPAAVAVGVVAATDMRSTRVP